MTAPGTWTFHSNPVVCCFRYHTLLGTYGVADLQNLSSSDMLATSLQGSFLHLEKVAGVRELCDDLFGGSTASVFILHFLNFCNVEVSKYV